MKGRDYVKIIIGNYTADLFAVELKNQKNLTNRSKCKGGGGLLYIHHIYRGCIMIDNWGDW